MLLRRPWVVLGSILAVSVGLSCYSVPAVDVGADVPVADGGVDAPDATDAPDTPDTPTDAPIAPGDPGWIHPSALPAECEMEVATFPERVMPAGVWIDDCGAGCRRWGNVGNLVHVDDADGVPIMVVIGGTPEGAPDHARYVVFAELDTGRAMFAIRDRALSPTRVRGEPFCAVDHWGVGGGGLAVSVSYLDYDAAGEHLERSWMRVLRAELEELPGSFRSLTHREPWGSSMAQAMVLSRSHVGLLFDWRLPMLVGNDGTAVVPTYGTGEVSEKLNLAITGESELFWERWTDVDRVVVRSSAGAAPEVMRAVDGAHIRSFASDGVDCAWLEARGWNDRDRTYESISLWTAAYDGVALVDARRVADGVPRQDDGAVGGGYYAHPEPDPEDATRSVFAFYRLSDGARATADPRPSRASDVLWLSAGEAVVAGGPRFRIDLRELHFE